MIRPRQIDEAGTPPASGRASCDQRNGAPSAPPVLAHVLAYCDAVAALDLDPYRVGAWCRAHSDGSPRGLFEAVQRLGERVPWELVRPEGPRDLRMWAEIAAASPKAERPHLVRVDPLRDWERCVEHERGETVLAPMEAVECAGREAGEAMARVVERMGARVVVGAKEPEQLAAK